MDYKYGYLTLLHSKRPKLHRVLALLSAIGLKCPPTKGEREYIGFSEMCQRDSLFSPYILIQWVESYQTCLDTSLRQAKELVNFFDFDPIFQGQRSLKTVKCCLLAFPVSTISLEPMNEISRNLCMDISLS